ncbi:MAG: 16S rRNA (guanine(966)-N(2))-methyltransferase RsmD [Acidobacteriota bacterium]
MRIIAGKYGRRRLASPRSGIRPTSDRLRETLFNVLGESVVGSIWLDLFAGSGAVGIEALSRGARLVLFNDKSPGAIKLLRLNLERCGVERGYDIFQKDAFTLLNGLRGLRAGFVFLDPPYDFPRHLRLLDKIGDSLRLGPEGIVLLELFKKTQLHLPAAKWQTLNTLRSGDSQMLVLRPQSEEGASGAEHAP